MSYNPVNWVNGETPINDTNLNNMDKGIAEAHKILADHDKKIDDFVKEQIPEEYVKGAVDDYISENQAGLASKEVVEGVAEEVGRLSSEIVETKNETFSVANDFNDNHSFTKHSSKEIVLGEKISAGTFIHSIFTSNAMNESHTSQVYIFNADNGVILDTFDITQGVTLDISKAYNVDVYIGGFFYTFYEITTDETVGTVNPYWEMSIANNVVTVNKTNVSTKMVYAIRVNVGRVTTLENEVSAIKNKIGSVFVAEKSVLIVAKDGSGDFSTINEAMKYADDYMSRDKQVTIVVYPGTYDETVNVFGNRFLSIVGVNKETCILRNDSGIYNYCPLRIQGNSYVANLTLISTHKNNEDFIVDGVLQQNPSYALHIDDRHADNDDDYVCEVFNCKMYSEQNPAVGIGLDKNQTVKLVNCEIISNISDDMLNLSGVKEGLWANKPNGGALFYHALYSGNYTDDNGYQKLVVKDCIITNNRDNVVFGEAGGMEEQVELTFINNVGMARNGRIFVKGLNGATISNLSFGNNMDAMNYAE